MNNLIYQCVVNNLATEIYSRLTVITCAVISEIRGLTNPSTINAYKSALDVYYAIHENLIIPRTAFIEYINNQLSYVELVDYYNSDIVGTNIVPTIDTLAIQCP